MRFFTLTVFLIAFLAVGSSFYSSHYQHPSADSSRYMGWTAYAGGKDGNRYSINTQINTANVSQLKRAWSYSCGDKDSANRSSLQTNPIMVDGVLYGVSPKLKLFALDAATGKRHWTFDPAVEEHNTNGGAYLKITRGVMYWQDVSGKDKRVLYCVNANLYAINAETGEPVRTFGSNGHINLKEDLDFTGRKDFFLVGTTPGVVYHDLFITGMRVANAPGHVRAYDIRTGKRKWIFHMIPHPGDPGYSSWDDKNAYKRYGEANSWAGMSLDEKRGIVFIPSGSADPDFYGGSRHGANLFGCTLVALNAATGKHIWHYQVVHHDLWDRDLPANPNLVTVKHNGKMIDAVAQITKHGYVYLLDRLTGKPLFPIPEVPVPQNALPGEKPWPTQPIPTLPQPFARQRFDPQDVNDLFPETKEETMAQYLKVKYREPWTPPSKDGSWVFPGFDGGGEWGGAAVDLDTHIMYVNSSELPWALVMVDAPKKNSPGSVSQYDLGKAAYARNCQTCHGGQFQGNPPAIPALKALGNKYNDKQLLELLDNGRGMMPSFKRIPAVEKAAILAYVNGSATTGIAAKPTKVLPRNERADDPTNGPDNAPYVMNGFHRFVDKNGYPGIKPPWGTLNAVDLNSGKLLWKVPLGEFPELTKRGIPITGTENYGGPVVTRGGLIFIAAARDEKLRAFDKNTGKVLWEGALPAGGFATPATYMLNGKQYVVIACGGGKMGKKSGDEYVAFALP